MPIRMEKDPQKNEPSRLPKERTDDRTSGALMRLLPLLLMFLFRKPKLLLVVVAVGAIWYYLGGCEGCKWEPDFDDDDETAQVETFSFGALLSEEEYDKASVFEPLSSVALGSFSNRLPASVSLLRYAPRRLHQGAQGSCVGWASSYAARTILEAMATGANPDDVAFSPAFLYNQIALSGCQGAYMNHAMDVLHERGDLPLSRFGYDERSCSRRPTPEQLAEAARYRIKGYTRLSKGASNYGVDVNAIKQHLAQGAPVVIGMMVGGSFMHQMVGRSTWRPTQRDYSGHGFSGHAMCVIGYDDSRQAFQIMNSWGPEWGQDGIAWVGYRDFEYFTKEAYGIFPMGQGEKFDPELLDVTFGLVNNETQRLIPLYTVGNKIFRTRSTLSPDDHFKVAIRNSIECNVYVFGEDTDGSSYVLFPYTEKHSPYCGITGTRLFPKDYSMSPDEIGTRDRIAIVITKEPVDWNALNSRINRSRRSTYAERVHEAIADQEFRDVRFEVDDAVHFRCRLMGKNAVAMVIEIDKR